MVSKPRSFGQNGRPPLVIQEARRALEVAALEILTPEQIQTTFTRLYEIRDRSTDDRARVMASHLLLERGLGKPRPAPDSDDEGDRLTDIRIRLQAAEIDRLKRELEEAKAQAGAHHGTYRELPSGTDTE